MYVPSMPDETRVCPSCELERKRTAFYNEGIPNLCNICTDMIVFGPHLELNFGTRPPRPDNCSCGAALTGPGWSQWCDGCRPLAARVTKYGLTVPEFRDLLKRQGNACAICLGPLTEATAQIDHDHDTGAVRGLLCFDDNVGIGFLRDDPERLRRAADYVEVPPARCG